MAQKAKVIQLYKNLLYMGRDYPAGYDYFREKLRKSFMRNRHVIDPEEIQKLISKGEFVIKEIEALYMLKKYRTLKKRYKDD